MQHIIPAVPAIPRRKKILSAYTLDLMEKRKLMRARPEGLSRRWSHSLDRLVSRSRRKDHRNFHSGLVREAFVADKWNDKAESSKIVKILTQKPSAAYWGQQPTLARDGSPILTDRKLAREWTEVRSVQFAARVTDDLEVRDPPGATSLEETAGGADITDGSYSSDSTLDSTTDMTKGGGTVGAADGVESESIVDGESSQTTAGVETGTASGGGVTGSITRDLSLELTIRMDQRPRK